MKIRYHVSQDIDIFLGKEEFQNLISKESKDFFEDNFVKAFSLEAKAYFYLGHCKHDVLALLAYADELDGGAQIVLPEENEDSYFINLPPKSEAVMELNEKGHYTARYLGGSKLMIIIKENQ